MQLVSDPTIEILSPELQIHFECSTTTIFFTTTTPADTGPYVYDAAANTHQLSVFTPDHPNCANYLHWTIYDVTGGGLVIESHRFSYDTMTSILTLVDPNGVYDLRDYKLVYTYHHTEMLVNMDYESDLFQV